MLRLAVYLLATLWAVQADLKCISFYGLCTPAKDLVCHWQHPPEWYIIKLKELGFNTIRLPWALQYVREGNFEKLDNFMNVLHDHQMGVLLDLHRIHYDHQDPTPTDESTAVTDVVNGWLAILDRYSNYDNVIGINAYNEYSFYDSDYLIQFDIEVMNSVEKRYPGRFEYFITGTNWGGELEHINLEALTYNARIHYSAHKYIFSIGDNKDYEHDWDVSLGPFAGTRAPGSKYGKVLIGEWGFKDPGERWWAERFIAHLKAHNITDTCFWTIALSGDTDGLWKDDCETLDVEKYKVIKTLWD